MHIRPQESQPGRPAGKALEAAGSAEERFQVLAPAGVRASGHLKQATLLMFNALKLQHSAPQACEQMLVAQVQRLDPEL